MEKIFTDSEMDSVMYHFSLNKGGSNWENTMDCYTMSEIVFC